ncbi:MAG: riboflavin kinase [Rikenellaceae bacterium]
MIIRGKVISGRQLGRKLGFPTANVAIAEDLQIANGVYSSSVMIDGGDYRAVSNVGLRPTVGGGERLVESHILDFSTDLYGQTIEINLIEKLRDEQSFESVEALRAQVELDIVKVKNIK